VRKDGMTKRSGIEKYYAEKTQYNFPYYFNMHFPVHRRVKERARKQLQMVLICSFMVQPSMKKEHVFRKLLVSALSIRNAFW